MVNYPDRRLWGVVNTEAKNTFIGKALLTNNGAPMCLVEPIQSSTSEEALKQLLRSMAEGYKGCETYVAKIFLSDSPNEHPIKVWRSDAGKLLLLRKGKNDGSKHKKR